MLASWQKKFKTSFEAYPNLVARLSSDDQAILARLLATLETRGALNEHVLHQVLGWCTRYLEELVSLIEKLAKVDAQSLNGFLSQKLEMNGLRRAIALFDLSGLPYNQDHLKALSVLIAVLANPLCQTIFDARLRHFSDYSEPSEPLNSSFAVDIILKLSQLKSQERRIAVFFDFFAQFRPFPNSQRDLVEVNVAEEVTEQLNDYCRELIQSVESQQDYLRVRKIIGALPKMDKSIVDEVKYPIASAIESADFASTRSYKRLMDEIDMALIKTQLNPKSLIQELESTKANFRTRRHSFFSASREEGHDDKPASADMTL